MHQFQRAQAAPGIYMCMLMVMIHDSYNAQYNVTAQLLFQIQTVWSNVSFSKICNETYNKFRNFEKKIYRCEKVLELPETCKSTKIFFWPL
jgi:hypothetical protein